MTWNFDPSHSSVNFSVRHMMLTTVRGRFTDVRLDVNFLPEQPAQSSVRAVLAATSVDTDQEARDQHLRSADFLDAATYPEITFVSTAVRPRGEQYQLDGDLTLHGITRPVTLDVTFEGIAANMQGGRRAAFSATTKISRQDWGLTWNVGLEAGGWLVSDEIKVDIDIALVEPA